MTETLFWTGTLSGWLVATAIGVSWRLWWRRKQRTIRWLID